MAIKAAAYARYSTDRQTENSIAYQLDKISEYCAKNQIQITAVFTDSGKSGTNMDREGFQDLVAAAKRREFEAVVIYDITRGSRDVGDWFTFRKEMMLLGIRIISTAQELGDLTDGNKFLMELISVGIGQVEVLNTRQKSIDGVAIKAKQGVFLGGTPPLGYDVVNGKYVINEPEAAIIRTIYTMYAAGESYDAILKKLNGACGKLGRPLSKNALHYLLKNERYVGVYTWNKKKTKLMRKWAGGTPNPNCVRIENGMPAIIDINTWEAVRNRMNMNKNDGRYRSKRRQYLLSGLITCDCCGATYVGHTSRNRKGYETSYYVCGNKYRTHACTAKNINASMIENYVVQQLREYLQNMDFRVEAQMIANYINSASESCEAEKRELVEIEKKIANGMKAILRGMDFPELEDEIAHLRLRKSDLEDIIAVHERENPTVSPEDIEAIFRESFDDLHENNIPKIIREHVKRIYAHSDGSFDLEIGAHCTGCGGRI